MTLRVAVIGVGHMGAAYARMVQQHPLGQLTALVANSAASVARAKEMFPGVPVTGAGDIPDGIDAAIVATPEWAHATPAVAALERGLHVLVEKPLADDLVAAGRILAAATLSRGIAMVCHTVRFDPRYIGAKAAVDAGAIGRIRHMTARRDADAAAYARVVGRTDPAFWLAPHDIDIMRWILGAEVAAVRARILRGSNDAPGGIDIDLTFANGATGRIETHWLTPPQHTRPRSCFLDIKGDAGAIEVNAYEQGLLIHRGDGTLDAPDTVYRFDRHGVIAGADAALIDHFLRCAHEGRTPVCGLADGFAAIAVADAASRSAALGAEVKVPA